MLKGVCSGHTNSHALHTHRFWNNTGGQNTEYTETTVRAEEDGSPPLRGESAGLHSQSQTHGWETHMQQ